MDNTWVTIFALLGGLFVLQGVAWGALAARARMRVLRHHRDLGRALAEHNLKLSRPAHRDCQVDERAMLIAAGAEPSTGADVLMVRQVIELAVTRQVLLDLRGPAALGALGVVFATVAAVWAVWI